jgi:SAM-dependent methyltransferase
MPVKPSDYPRDRAERPEFEWRAYDDYYSDQTLEHPYFYLNDRLEGRFIDCMMARFQISPGATLLDVGCGNGFHSNLFQQRGVRVTGVDRSDKAIQYCKAKYGEDCEWVCDDAFALPAENRFDYAFCFWFMYFNAFENPADPAATEAATRLMRYLKPGGKLFFLWHSDLTAVRLPPDRFSVMNFTISQLKAFFPSYAVEAYAIDSWAKILAVLGKRSFNKYVTRLSCAYVYMQASTWKRTRLMLVVHKQDVNTAEPF